MIGPRLRLARAAAGLSLRELEGGLQGLMTAQAIGKYERDEMMPSSSVLIALARTLKVSEEYLLNPADIDLVGVEFRKKKLTSARETAEVQARILSEVERYLEIEQILAVNTPEVFPAKVRPRVTSVEDVDAAAKDLRKRWHLGDDAIPNLCEFLEEKGIKICAIELPDNVSGVQATVKSTDGAGVPVIVVNANDPGERQRFTVAHELGHLYLDIPKPRDPEPLCHRFAGAFLVPGQMLQKEVGNYRRAISVRELFQLKQLFGVSAQAIAYRCKDLGIISHATFSNVFKAFGIKKWRRNEPNALPKEQPSRFERLCIRALAEDVISEARASELLRKTVREVVESLDRPPEDPSDVHASRVLLKLSTTRAVTLPLRKSMAVFKPIKSQERALSDAVREDREDRV